MASQQGTPTVNRPAPIAVCVHKIAMGSFVSDSGFYINVGSTDSKPSELCVNNPLYIDKRFRWKTTKALGMELFSTTEKQYVDQLKSQIR